MPMFVLTSIAVLRRQHISPSVFIHCRNVVKFILFVPCFMSTKQRTGLKIKITWIAMIFFVLGRFFVACRGQWNGTIFLIITAAVNFSYQYIAGKNTCSSLILNIIIKPLLSLQCNWVQTAVSSQSKPVHPYFPARTRCSAF